MLETEDWEGFTGEKETSRRKKVGMREKLLAKGGEKRIRRLSRGVI